MSSYSLSSLSSLITTTTSRYTSALRQRITTSTSESDDAYIDTPDASHVSRVLRAYYRETRPNQPLPEWLGVDPRDRDRSKTEDGGGGARGGGGYLGSLRRSAASAGGSSGAGQGRASGGGGGGGGLGEIWGDSGGGAQGGQQQQGGGNSMRMAVQVLKDDLNDCMPRGAAF
ncbi:MAG: hypothetical protein LQ338_004384 [Usnochroma carphineum]|nr:MAG: hypothetical protein LQ338_004384 [Usnochroma carphineum]